MKKLFYLVAASVLAVFLLASCGKSAAPTKPTNVFRETLISMPEEYTKNSNTNIQNTVVCGNTAYMTVYQWDNTNYRESYWVQPVNLSDGSFGEKIPVEIPNFADGNGGGYPQAITADSSGTVYLLMEIYSYSDTGYTQENRLVKIKDGKSESVTIKMPEDEEIGDSFYVASMEVSNDGVLILQSWNALCLQAPDGTMKLLKLDDPNNMQYDTVKKIDGKIYVGMWEYTEESASRKMVELDPKTGEFGKELKINSNHSYNMSFGPGYDYYYNDRSSVWGVDSESGEMTEVLNFINSDINANDVNTIIPLSADRFFYSYYQRPAAGDRYTQFAFLDRIPDDQVVEKKILRLAVDYVGYDLRAQVIAFNKKSEEYRITIDDYSRYDTDENYNASQEVLNQDIIQGKIPDIFILTSEMPYSTYASKGIFADLYELMDADESFDRSQYLENIFKAYEYDGELLSLVPTFHISTFAADPKHLDGITSWNMEEFMAFAKAHPEMSMFDYDFNRSRFVELFMRFSRSQFIDDETGKCSFDSPEFKQLLEFAKSLGEEDFWSGLSEEEQMDNNFWQEYEERFTDGRVLLVSTFISDFESTFKSLMHYTLKAEPEFIGFPVADGNGALISGNTEYAISRRSKFKDGAWEFLKTLIAEENFMPVYNEEYKYWEYPTYGIPIYKPAVDKMVEIAMTPRNFDDDPIDDGFVVTPAVPYVMKETASATLETESAETEVIVEDAVDLDGDGMIDGGFDIVLPEEPIESWTNPYDIPLTEKQADKLLALINGTTHVERYDFKLNDIINEELEMYFAGAKSVDETAKLIQNRVNIYVNESR